MHDQNLVIPWDDLAESLPLDWIAGSRWFRRKSERIAAVRFLDGAVVEASDPAAKPVSLLVLVEVALAGGETDIYLMPLALDPPGTPARPDAFRTAAGRQFNQALDLPSLHTSLARRMHTGEDLESLRGRFVFEAFPFHGDRQCRPLAETSSNSLVLIKGDVALKYYRRAERGISPELEMNRYFAEHGGFTRLPQLTGSVRYLGRDGLELTVAMAQAFVENEGDLWAWTQDYLKGILSEAVTAGFGSPEPFFLERSRAYFDGCARLGGILAQMHQVLAEGRGGPNFTPEPIGPADLAEMATRMREGSGAIFRKIAALPSGGHPVVARFLEDCPRLQGEVDRAFGCLTRLNPAGWQRTRVHGDFHLGQVLKARDDFYLMDFEGEPLKQEAQRVAKYSPFKDVAGICRSYNYAVYAALFDFTAAQPLPEDACREFEQALLAWNGAAEAALRRGYEAESGQPIAGDLAILLELLKLEKAVYELDYEINNRPAWLPIPVSGITACLKEIFHE